MAHAAVAAAEVAQEAAAASASAAAAAAGQGGGAAAGQHLRGCPHELLHLPHACAHAGRLARWQLGWHLRGSYLGGGGAPAGGKVD